MDPVVWSFFLVVVAVSVVAYFVLKVLAKVVADHRTKKILKKGMEGEESEGGEGPSPGS